VAKLRWHWQVHIDILCGLWAIILLAYALRGIDYASEICLIVIGKEKLARLELLGNNISAVA
jgi:hypothetical protein